MGMLYPPRTRLIAIPLVQPGAFGVVHDLSGQAPTARKRSISAGTGVLERLCWGPGVTLGLSGYLITSHLKKGHFFKNHF
jgi:hypothetical protein